MKSINNFCLFVLFAIGFTSCTSYGKEYKLDSKHNVFYKGDGLDENVAKKVGEYLVKKGIFPSDKEATVQLTKSKDTFNLNFVFDKSKVDAEIESAFVDLGGYISESIFNNSPVTIHLCNDHLESFENIGYCKPKAEGAHPVSEKEYKLDDRHNILYNDVDEATAKKLADYLKQEDYFQEGITATVQLGKNRDTFKLNFVVDPSKIDATKESQFVIFGGDISQYVFDNRPVTLGLCNTEMMPVKNLGYCAPKMVEPANAPGQ